MTDIPTPPASTCATCPAWRGPNPDSALGFCRAFPQEEYVAPDDWCMQHPARRAAMEAPKIREMAMQAIATDMQIDNALDRAAAAEAEVARLREALGVIAKHTWHGNTADDAADYMRDEARAALAAVQGVRS